MDDVLGLIVLAVVTGLASGGALAISTVAVIFFKAAGFLMGVLLLAPSSYPVW